MWLADCHKTIVSQLYTYVTCYSKRYINIIILWHCARFLSFSVKKFLLDSSVQPHVTVKFSLWGSPLCPWTFLEVTVFQRDRYSSSRWLPNQAGTEGLPTDEDKMLYSSEPLWSSCGMTPGKEEDSQSYKSKEDRRMIMKYGRGVHNEETMEVNLELWSSILWISFLICVFFTLSIMFREAF